MVAMAQPLSTPQQSIPSEPSRKGRRGDRDGRSRCSAPPAWLGALALWFHYGTAVFFEMIASGIAACF